MSILSGINIGYLRISLLSHLKINDYIHILQVSLQSQEAYEIAAKGPVRPENLSDGLIYSLKCIKYSPPDFTLDATCVGANGEYLASLIDELGIKLKTSAVTSSIRILRYGYFDVNSALLYKHCTLENMIQNICDNEVILQQLGSPHKHSTERDEEQNIPRPHFEKLNSIHSIELD